MKDFNTLTGPKALAYVRIAQVIRDYIASAEMTQGDRLPSERKLCERLGASRTSVREALRQLENQGIIRVEPGRGAFVVQPSDERSVVLHFVKQDMEQHMELRALLETRIIRHAAENATPSQLDAMEGIAHEMMRAYESGVYPAALDTKFHDMLGYCTPNLVMRELVHRLIRILADYWDSYAAENIWAQAESRRCLMETVPLHCEIVDALRAHQADRACEAYQRIYQLDIQMFQNFVTR